MPEWDGKERRSNQPDLSAIWELLHEIKLAQELHLQRDAEVQPKLLELISVLEKSKGALTLIKWLAAVCSFTAAAVIWAKDHLKL